LKVYITGIGCITPIGSNQEENLNSLKKGISGLKKAEIFQSKYAANFYFGEVNYSNEQITSMVGLEEAKGITRTDLLAFKAFSEAVRDANLSEEEISSTKTAFISASTVGGMCLTNQLYDDSNLKSETNEFLESYSAHAHAAKIVEKYKIKGWVDVINTACSSSANAIMNGARLIKSGRAQRVIVGGVDSLSKYTVNGFNSLQILSTEKCAPFDANRQGLNLGEAGAYLVLENEETAQGKKKYAKVVGYGNTNDAFHTSSLSEEGDGIVKVIREALQVAALQPNEIDYINAHGTGTQNNDVVELNAFQSVFETVPPFNSTKSYVGHTLGAAGAVEAIFSIFSLINDEVYAQLNFTTPIETHSFSPVVEKMKTPVRFAMSNSYGFSGNCTSLIFEKV